MEKWGKAAPAVGASRATGGSGGGGHGTRHGGRLDAVERQQPRRFWAAATATGVGRFAPHPPTIRHAGGGTTPTATAAAATAAALVGFGHRRPRRG